MKQLKDLLFGVQLDAIQGSTHIPIKDISFDSRKVVENGVFVAISGGEINGHEYISNAISKGATAIICEEKPSIIDDKVCWIYTKSCRKALAVLAANFYDNPSSKLKLIGITGTNGKTTVASLLYKLFNAAGYGSGLLSTIEIAYENQLIDATHTTPDPLQLNMHLNKMVNLGLDYCFMEVSSHGIDQGRIHALDFAGGVFTNITHDHLDYHGSFAEYRDVKKQFFDQLSQNAFALVNADDKNGEFMLQNSAAKRVRYGLQNYADYKAQILEHEFSGMLLKIDNHEFWSTLIGQFNASNLLAVYAVARLMDLDSLEILELMSKLKNVKGRFQIYQTPNSATVIVDYAHTPDALKNVLATIAQIRTKNETLLTVVGCGGNRDHDKRPMMGNVAAKSSDYVIFTSDNPRDENPDEIIDAMEKGVAPEDYKKTLRIPNRKEAIKAACMRLVAGDVLLIAGKGHENYQEIKGERHPFDDYQVVHEICKQLF